MVIGTLSPYLVSVGGDSTFLGIVIAAFSLGRLVASFTFGALADVWCTRSVLLLSTAGCILGNFLFCFAGTVSSKYVLLLSRMLTGFGTGMLSVARTHVSLTTPGEERTLWMSWLGIVQFVGFAITPVVGNVNLTVDLKFMLLNNFTFATLLLCLLEVCLFLCLLLFMSKRSAGDMPASNITDSTIAIPTTCGNDRESESVYYQIQDDSVHHVDFQNHLANGAEEKEIVYLEDELSHGVRESGQASQCSSMQVEPHVHPQKLCPFSGGNDIQRSNTLHRCRELDSMEERDVPIVDEMIAARQVLEQNCGRPSETFRGALSPVGDPAQPVLASFTGVTPAARSCSCLSRWILFTRESYVPLIFVLLNFSGRGILSVAETYGAMIYDDIGASDTSVNASTFFLIMGCIGLLVFLCMNKLIKYVEETSLLILAFISMGIGFGVIVDFDGYDIDIYDFSAGMTLIWVLGTPISQTLSVSMLSKHFNQQLKDGITPTKGIGFWMGLVTASGSVGRIMFPLVAGALYGSFGVSSAALFTSLTAFATAILIFFSLRTYSVYLPWLKQRLECLLVRHQPLDSLPDIGLEQ